MSAIPTEVSEYLASKDPLFRAQLHQRFPGLQQTLADSATRVALIEWLASDASWSPSATGYVANCLEFLRPKADPSEVSVVRTFLLHGEPFVRLRAYEFLLTLYFPDRNREAMILLLHGMLADADDTIRSQAVRYIERAGVAGELREFLLAWRKIALGRGWQNTDSFELVTRLLGS